MRSGNDDDDAAQSTSRKRVRDSDGDDQELDDRTEEEKIAQLVDSAEDVQALDENRYSVNAVLFPFYFIHSLFVLIIHTIINV